MTGLHLSPTDVLIGVAALVVFGYVWRAGARQARAAERAVRGGVRLVSLAGRVLFTASLIVGAQWSVIAVAPSRWALVGILAGPALFAAYTLTRALTIMTDEPEPCRERARRDGGRR